MGEPPNELPLMVTFTEVRVDAEILFREMLTMFGRVVLVRIQLYDAFFEGLILLIKSVVFIGLLGSAGTTPGASVHGGVITVTELPLALTISRDFWQ